MEKAKNKYHFIIFGSSDWMKNSIYDILCREDVEYYDFILKRTFIEKVFISKIIPLFLKKIIFILFKKRLFPVKIKSFEQKNIYIFYERNKYSVNHVVLSWIKKKDPSAYFVFILTNIMSDSWKINHKNTYEYLLNNEIYNLVITFDANDAKKYGFTFFNFVNSPYKYEVKKEQEFDMFFCGINKGRLQKLCSLGDRLSSMGFTYQFIVIDSDMEEKNDKGIKILNKIVPNELVLNMMCNCKCVVDLSVDKTFLGLSLRVSEALANSKLLITDNMHIYSDPLFNENQMIVFERPEDITKQEILGKMDKTKYSKPSVVSPELLLDLIIKSIDK